MRKLIKLIKPKERKLSACVWRRVLPGEFARLPDERVKLYYQPARSRVVDVINYDEDADLNERVMIKFPALIFASHHSYAGRFHRLFAARWVDMKPPQDALEIRTRIVAIPSLANVMEDNGEVCLGSTAPRRINAGRLLPVDAFWMTAFEEEASSLRRSLRSSAEKIPVSDWLDSMSTHHADSVLD